MTKINQTSELTAKMLAPLKDWCERTEGGMKTVLELYNKGLAKPVSLPNIYRCLRKNKDNKVYEPKAGTLLRLLECYQAIRGTDIHGEPMPSIYCTVNGHTPAHSGLCCKVCKSIL